MDMSRLLHTLLYCGILAALTVSIGWAQAPEESMDRAPVTEPAPQVAAEDRSALTPQTNQVQAAEAPEPRRAVSPNEKTVVAAEGSAPSGSHSAGDIVAARAPKTETRQSRDEAVGRQPTEIFVNGQMPSAGVQNRSALLVLLLILFGCAVVGVVVWITATSHSRRIKAALRADVHTRQALLDVLCRTKEKRTRTESSLASIYRETKDSSVRRAAIEALCAVTDSKAAGRDVLRYLDMAFRDADASVRRVAYDLALRSADAKIIERLISQLSIEPDTATREMIVTGFLAWKEQSVCAAMAELRLDEADAGVRAMVAYGVDQDAAAILFNRIAVLREQKVKSDAAEASDTRVRRSQELAEQAAQSVAAGETDNGEDLIRRSLAEDPGNEMARRLLSDLPQLRNQMAAASKARFQSALLQCLQERHAILLRRIQDKRSDVERLFAARDLDTATDRLLDMTALDPAEEWASAMLAQMPRLQEDCRRAVLEREINEQIARVRDLKAQLEDAWQRRDLDRAEEAAVALQAIHPADEQTSAFLCRIAGAKRRKASEEAWANIEKALNEGDLDRAESALRSLACCDDFDRTRVNAVMEGLARLRSELHASEQRKTQLERVAKADELRKKVAGLLAKGSAEKAEPMARELVALVPDDQSAAALLARVLDSIRQARVDDNMQAIETALRDEDLPSAERLVRETLPIVDDKARLEAILDKIPVLRAQAAERNLLAEARARLEEKDKVYAQVQTHLEKCEWDDAENAATRLIGLDPADQTAAAYPARIAEARARIVAEQAWSEVSAAMAEHDWTALEKHLQQLVLCDDQQQRAERVIQQIPILEKAAEEQSAAARQQQVRQQAQSLRDAAVSLKGKDDLDGALAKIDAALAVVPVPADAELVALRMQILSSIRHKQVEAKLSEIRSHLEHGDFDQAEAALRSLLPISDDPSVVHRMLSEMPELRQKQQASTASAEEAKSQDVSLKALKEAQKLFEQGKLSDAAAKLRKSIASDPSNERAAKLLQRVFQFDSAAASGAPRTRLDSYGQIVEDSSS